MRIGVLNSANQLECNKYKMPAATAGHTIQYVAFLHIYLCISDL